MKKVIKYNKYYNIIISDSEKYSDEEIKSIIKESIKYLRKQELKDSKNKVIILEDEKFIEDIPLSSPEEEIKITYNEPIKGGKNALTYAMVETAFKNRSLDEGQTFKVYIEEVLKSLKEDLENAKYLVSGEMQSTRKLLLEDYVKIEQLLRKAGMTEKLEEMQPLVDELSSKLDLDKWKAPKFTKSKRIQASKELRKLHKNDSYIQRKIVPIYLCSPVELKQSYIDAKNGKLPEVFKANLEKMKKDILSDYERIVKGKDTYIKNPSFKVLLPDIIVHYETALDYAKDLEYFNYVDEVEPLVKTIKEAWE